MPEQVDLQAGGGKREEAALDVGFSDQSAAKDDTSVTESTSSTEAQTESATALDSSLQVSSILEAGERPHIPEQDRPRTNAYEIPNAGSFVAKAENSTDIVFKPTGDEEPPRDNCSSIYYMPLPTSQKIRELSPEEQIPAIQTISLTARDALIYCNTYRSSFGRQKPAPKSEHQNKLIQDLLVLEDGRKAPYYTRRRDLFLLEYKSSEASIVLQPNDQYQATALIYGSAKQKGQAISLLQQYDSIIRYE